ncbi:MAG: alpha-L-arabinofuranosidase [Lachnospiraceae bacterium]|nr:alpha-L-arabinofuranosidase [Lachnospiraceae bacterium]
MAINKLAISKKVAREINPDMIGLFFEDINFAADGGLYAELLENRSFEAIKTKGTGRNYVLTEDNLYAWSSVEGKEGALEINCNQPISEKNPHYLRFTAFADGEGFANKAYDGVCLKKDAKYKVSFYAKEVDYSEGDIEAKVVKDGTVYADVTVKFVAAKPEPDGYKQMVGDCEDKIWRKYETVLTAGNDIKGAQFEIHLTKAGIVEFDIVSMIPEDAVAGVFRKDLFKALADLNPGFLRFPGGCIVEGTSIMRRYRWKDTVGPIENRKINTNLWAAVGGNTSLAWEMPDSHYMQSYGIGFYEYFLLCELLSNKRTCKAVPVLNIGVACQFRSYETIAIDDPAFDEYVQDALDLIEFANGPVDSKWGALRAKMGHPESFKLEMIAIGNEQWESRHVNVADRYKIFEKAIHDKYPEIKCLGTAGPFVNHELHTGAWNVYHEESKTNPNYSYAVDEHYYVAPQWLYDNVAFYDNYPRDVYVFAGEYAAHDANLSNSVEAGVAEAAMMTGMERNGDVVKLASYAPLFNRIGHSHWTPDMIWFNEDSVTLTPSYYVQKLFSDYAGTQTLELNDQEKMLRNSQLYVSLVKMGDKAVLKVVNGKDEDQVLELNTEDGNSLICDAEVITMKAASGKAIVPEASDAIAADNNHAVSTEIMSNAELCAKRCPEEASYTSEKIKLSGSIDLPAKSVIAVAFDL